MLFSTLSLFLAAASAAPVKRELCTPNYAPDGTYIDDGCGIVLRANGGLCVRTDYDTAPGAPVYLEECVAGSRGKSGGRWSVSLGATALRNVEAASPDYCLAANAERTLAVVQKCDESKPEQQWDTALAWGNEQDARIKLRGEDVCLQATKDGKKDQLQLGKCGCGTDQIFDAPLLA